MLSAWYPEGAAMHSFLWRFFAYALLCFGPLQAIAAGPLEFSPYEFETSRHGTIAAEIAYLDVPTRHHVGGSPRMRLRVVRLPALSGASQRPPIVYLAGGPGGSGVGAARGARWPVFDRVRQHADVLLLDQRGTGLSGRIPECPYRHEFGPGQSADAPTYLSQLNQVAVRCVALWRSQGVDLDAYNTVDSAHDVESLRVALGVDQISLWGTSYGSHLAMAVLRLHGDHIDRAVLMGVEGPDDTLKLPMSADALLGELADRLRQDAEASGLGPDLIGTIRCVLSRLEQAPVEGHVRRPFNTRLVTIGKFDAQLAIAAALGRTRTARLLPLAMNEAERGNYDVLAEFVHAVRQELGSFNAMPLAMDIASGASDARDAQVAQGERDSLLGPALNFPLPGIAAGLGITELDTGFRTTLGSDVPTLFVSGSLDGRTPPANAHSAASGFANAHQLLIDGAGHDDDLWLSHEAIRASIDAFFAGQAAPDTVLVAAPMRFADSVTGEIWRVLVLQEDGNVRGAATGLGLAVVLLLLAVDHWWRTRRNKRRWRADRPASTEPGTTR